ncbi:MAG: YihY/virulence factor BrkB family protein [Crocinitomicaceae bacterium]|nr:YihY/virulence factor BrkB family protein [Crocinitomicaceae bacterium]
MTSIKKPRANRWYLNFQIIKLAFVNYIKEGAFFHGAALAYYTLFALFPILYLSISSFGKIVGRDKMVSIIQQLFYEKVGLSDTDTIIEYLKVIDLDNGSWLMSVVSILVLLYACSAFLVSLKRSLNDFFDVKHDENDNIVLKLVSFRFLSVLLLSAFALVIILFYFFQIFVVSLIEHSVLSYNGIINFSMLCLDHALSIISNVIIFWVILKYVNDAKVSNKLALKGAVLTALLLYGSQLAIKYYLQNYFFLGKSGIAGSLFILLAWVNYSAQIIFFGAKYTHVLQQKTKAGLI